MARHSCRHPGSFNSTGDRQPKRCNVGVMSFSPILELVPGDVVYLPISRDGTTQGSITVEWVREVRDGTLCVGWHAGGEDHVLCLPLDLAALGA